MNDKLIDLQIEYYRRRAPEYDRWFYREGRYDRGPEFRHDWLAELKIARAALFDFAPFGSVLEIAGGTGIWTRELARSATSLTVVDSSPEVLELNQARLKGLLSSHSTATLHQAEWTDDKPSHPSCPVHYEIADLFKWTPDRRFDFVFFGFWLSHVPEDRFDTFWSLVATCLVPGGRVFFVDSLPSELSGACNHVSPDAERGIARRQLEDGSEFEVVKIFHEPATLLARLERLGWTGFVKRTNSFALYGSLTTTI